MQTITLTTMDCLSKYDVALILTNQFLMEEEKRDSLARKISQKSSDELIQLADKAGFTIEELGHAKFYIK